MDDEDDAGAAELNALTARTHSIMEKKISVSSRRTYHASQIRLLLWWFEKRPALLMDAFRLELASHAARSTRKGFIKSVLGPPANKLFPPLKWDEVVYEDFSNWICSLKKRGADNRPLAFTTLCTHRSALSNLYDEWGQKMSSALEQHTSGFYRGLRRETAQKAQEGNIDNAESLNWPS